MTTKDVEHEFRLLMAYAAAGKFVLDNTNDWDRLMNPVLHAACKIFDQTLEKLEKEST